MLLITQLLFSVLVVISRPFAKKRSKYLIVLYGHKLSGNLKALYQEVLTKNRPDFDIYFLTLDPDYGKQLRQSGISALACNKLTDMLKLRDASVIVTDHGLHGLIILLKLTSIKFVDVWHGIPFKGFDKHDFKVQHQYDAVLVSSEKLKQIYVRKFGFEKSRVFITGYGRTDLIFRASKNISSTKTLFNIPDDGRKILLYAPTWRQDDKKRNIYPFGLSEKTFIDSLKKICIANNAIAIIRMHLNSDSSHQELPDPLYIRTQSFYPDTESLLAISDILLCDWSSIAFDYLVLDRPTIFLDVPPPFLKGFTLGPEYRFGKVVNNMGDLEYYLNIYAQSPEQYTTEFGSYHAGIKREIYDLNLDQRSSNRYIESIKNNVRH